MKTNTSRLEMKKPLTVKETIHVQSISSYAWKIIQSLPESVCPVGVFTSSIDFLAGEEIFALVNPSLLNGPFNIVVDSIPSSTLPPSCLTGWDEAGLSIDSWSLRMPEPLAFWNPRPCWSELSLPARSVEALLATASMQAKRRSSRSPFIDLLLGIEMPLLDPFGRAVKAFDGEAMKNHALPLAGLGPGLTPSGDDFLAGVMLGLHAQPLAEDFRAFLCMKLYEAAAGRTSRLSLAFLRAARGGMADERWHRLLSALDSCEEDRIRETARDAMNFGETSGIDMVCGFLWLCRIINLSG